MTMIKELPRTAKYIEGSEDHWIDVDGSVYAYNTRNNQKRVLIKKSQHTVYGYKYCGIRYKGMDNNISKRVHRLVAEAFIPNPNNYNVVGHRNNIKDDNRVENLYWTTIQENTQKAYDDGLAKNDQGYNDSQSNPVIMFETATNKKINEYGSICEASKQTGISKNTISRQAKYNRPVRKPFYFRYVNDESVIS